MVHVTLGLFLIALGVWGLFDAYYYVMDFFKGGIPLLLLLLGLLAALAGFVPPKVKEDSDGD